MPAPTHADPPGRPTPAEFGADVELDRMSPEATLARKVRWGKVFALMETVFYAALIPLMVRHFFFHDNSTANKAARTIISYFHGFVVMAFCYIVFDLRRLLKWSWPFFVFALLPIGSLFAHARLRRCEGELRAGVGPAGPTGR